MKKALVAYFSASGVTEQVAEKLASAAHADCFRIQPKIAYAKADLDWTNKSSRSSVEMSDPASRPEIVNENLDVSSYDTIFIGFPIWWYVAPTIINTFLESFDLSGKTIVPFATAYNKSVLDGTYDPNDYEWLGYEYSPSPVKTTVQRISDGAQVGNNDSKARAEHASYTGLLFKKYVDESFLENGKAGAPTTYPMLRYGDVLLMYAEAMNEMNQCSQEVLDATINKLRERAYNGTGLEYPRVTEGSQQQLRTVIRTERFIEMAWEGHRYSDLIRWKIAGKVFNRPIYFLNRA